MRILLNHGQTERYVHKYIGFNGRLDAIQAAVLDVKLKYFNAELAKRQIIAKNYNEKLENVITPFIAGGNESAWAQYCIRVKNRQKVLEICAKEGIPTGVYYPIPLHLQEVFAYLGHKKGDFPITEKYASEVLSLPMYNGMTEEEQDTVIKTINEFR